MRCCIIPTGSQYTNEQFQKLMADHGVVCSLSRSGNVWDNAAMEVFFSSLKTEHVGRKTYRTRDEARADVFDYIERFYNPKRTSRGFLALCVALRACCFWAGGAELSAEAEDASAISH